MTQDKWAPGMCKASSEGFRPSLMHVGEFVLEAAHQDWDRGPVTWTNTE
jgi:hypothetical protein